MQYPGGKGSHYHKIINLMPPHDVYIELFLGGGSVMCAKRPTALNIGVEINPAVLRETAASIAPGAIVISGDSYRCTSLNPARGSGIEAHAKNSDGAAPSQMASAATIAGNGDGGHPFDDIARSDEGIRLVPLVICDDAEATPQTTMVNHNAGNDDARWRFYCTDALAFLDSYPFTGREFIYADPPYLMSTRRSQRQLYLYELGEREQHIALLNRLKQLPCHVAISGYWSDLYGDMLAGWHTYSFRARTRGGPLATEWLWMNYPEPTALHDYQYLGDGFRERERIRRKKQRWTNNLQKMDKLERQAVLWAIQEAGLLPGAIVENDEAPAKLAEVSPQMASPAGIVICDDASWQVARKQV